VIVVAPWVAGGALAYSAVRRLVRLAR
jgi:hypothetical protein